MLCILIRYEQIEIYHPAQSNDESSSIQLRKPMDYHERNVAFVNAILEIQQQTYSVDDYIRMRRLED